MTTASAGFGCISATIDDESTCSVDESSGSRRSKCLDYYDYTTVFRCSIIGSPP